MRSKAVIESAFQALRRHLLTAVVETTGKDAKGADDAPTRVRIGRGSTLLGYDAEVHPTFTPRTAGPILNHFRHVKTAKGLEPLLVTGYVTPPMAEKLRDEGRQFVDRAGNAYLDRKGLFVWVVGRKPPTGARRRSSEPALTNAGLRVLFALMCDERLAGATHRIIAEAADVALGVIPRVLADLHKQGRLAVAGRNRKLVASKRLLDDWATAYARTLRPKTLTQRYAVPNIQDWRQWRLAPFDGQWGGEPAAHRLVGFLTPGVLTIYASRSHQKLVVDRRLQVVDDDDPRGLVEVRRPFWGATLQKPELMAETVPAALVYSELLAVDEARCRQAADLVYENHLARRFPT